MVDLVGIGTLLTGAASIGTFALTWRVRREVKTPGNAPPLGELAASAADTATAVHEEIRTSNGETIGSMIENVQAAVQNGGGTG